MKTYFNTLNHPVDLHDGRVVPASETAYLDGDLDPHDQALVDEGTLLEVSSPEPPPPPSRRSAPVVPDPS